MRADNAVTGLRARDHRVGPSVCRATRRVDSTVTAGRNRHAGLTLTGVVTTVLTRAVQGVFRQRADADEIVPGLWVGSAPSSVQVAALVSAGIDAVVDLRAEDDAVRREWPDYITVAVVPLRDHGTPSLDVLGAAATAVSDLMGAGRTVLVHCHAGVERAPTVACAALVQQGWSLEDAYRRVTERRSVAAPTDGQLASLSLVSAAKHDKESPLRGS